MVMLIWLYCARPSSEVSRQLRPFEFFLVCRAAKEEEKRLEKEAKALQRQTSKSVRGKDSEKEITVLLDHGMAGPDAGMRLVTSRLNADYNVEEEKLRVDQSMQWRRMVHKEDDGGPGKVSKVEVAPIVWVYLTPER
jgi:hypothetical protein